MISPPSPTLFYILLQAVQIYFRLHQWTMSHKKVSIKAITLGFSSQLQNDVHSAQLFGGISKTCLLLS